MDVTEGSAVATPSTETSTALNTPEIEKQRVDEEDQDMSNIRNKNVASQPTENRPFALKKWNALAMWAWDVECDTCAICRVHLMEECLRCQAEPSTSTECVVVWGDCNHSFHNCCMSQWVRQNNRCPLCQQDWVVQRIGQ